MSERMQLRKLGAASREIASIHCDGSPFPDHMRQIMRILRDLVACDTINLGTVDLESEEGFHLDLDGFLMPEEKRAQLPRFKHQHPMLEYTRTHDINPPLRFSDFLSRRQFEETGLYRECYHGHTHSMVTFGVDSPPGLNISFVLSRASTEFSDDDVSLLSILQPLITVTFQRLLLETALESRANQEGPIGVIVGSGQSVITLDKPARHLLSLYFPDHNPHLLPSELYHTARQFPGRIATFSQQADGTLLSGIHEPTGSEWLLSLWEESSPLPSAHLSKVGLSGRQIEVLQWLVRGKTNAEIALILGISYRTVQKHLENIYRTIGVETRLAALAYCRRACR